MSDTPEPRVLLDDLVFGEGPRYRDGKLYVGQFIQKGIGVLLVGIKPLILVVIDSA